MISLRVAAAVPSRFCTHFSVAVQCVLLTCAQLRRKNLVDLGPHKLAELRFGYADLAILANPPLRFEGGCHQMPYPLFGGHVLSRRAGRCLRQVMRRNLAPCAEIRF